MLTEANEISSILKVLNILPYPILRPWWFFFPPSPLYRLRNSCLEGSTYLSECYVTEPKLASLFSLPGSTWSAFCVAFPELPPARIQRDSSFCYM